VATIVGIGVAVGVGVFVGLRVGPGVPGTVLPAVVAAVGGAFVA
jgi:hypothetical protein